jgi:hypothetical protein
VGFTTLPQVAYYITNTQDRTIGYGAEPWSAAGLTHWASGVFFTQDNWAGVAGPNNWTYAIDGNTNTGPYSTNPDRWIQFGLGLNVQLIFSVTAWWGYPGTFTWSAVNESLSGPVQTGQITVPATGPVTVGPNQVNNPSGKIVILHIGFGAGLGSPGIYKLREFQVTLRQITGQTPVYNQA